MVVKIAPSSPTLRYALSYNSEKASRGEGRLVTASGMDFPGEDGIWATFARYERLNYSSKNVSFHMFICPSDAEAFDDGKASSMAAELMAGLGYGSQPYAVFRHDDAGTPHYHVLSCRVGNDGRKIRDYNDVRVLQRMMREMAGKYGYSIGDGTREAQKAQGIDARMFDRRKGHVGAQMQSIFDECLSYRFTSFPKFQRIMQEHGVKAESRAEGDSWSIILQGLDRNGRPCTRRLSEDALSPGMYGKYESRALACKESTERLVREKTRIRTISTFALENSRSEAHFLAILRNKGLDAEIFRDSDGKASGINFIDGTTRCAFKASEIRGGITAEDINEAAGGRWTEESPVQAETEGITLGELIAGTRGSLSKSHEKDPKDNRKKKSRGII